MKVEFGIRAPEGGICRKCIVLLVITSALAAFAIGMGGASFFALVPLQFAYERRGSMAFVMASGIALLIGGILLAIGSSPSAFALVLASAVLSLLSLTLLNWRGVFEQPRLEPWLRVVFAIIVASAASALVIASPVFQSVLHSQLNAWLEAMFDSEQGAELFSVLGNNQEQVFAFLWSWLYRSIAPAAGLSTLIAFAVARTLSRGSGSLVDKLSRYNLPPWMVWSVILPAVSTMISSRFGNVLAEAISWNILLSAALLYVLQGVGVLARVSKNRPFLRAIFPSLCIILSIMPGLNVMSAIAVCVLGITSVWIQYSDGTVETE